MKVYFDLIASEKSKISYDIKKDDPGIEPGLATP